MTNGKVDIITGTRDRYFADEQMWYISVTKELYENKVDLENYFDSVIESYTPSLKRVKYRIVAVSGKYEEIIISVFVN